MPLEAVGLRLKFLFLRKWKQFDILVYLFMEVFINEMVQSISDGHYDCAPGPFVVLTKYCITDTFISYKKLALSSLEWEVTLWCAARSYFCRKP